jgi:hypothetical protein
VDAVPVVRPGGWKIMGDHELLRFLRRREKKLSVLAINSGQ